MPTAPPELLPPELLPPELLPPELLPPELLPPLPTEPPEPLPPEALPPLPTAPPELLPPDPLPPDPLVPPEPSEEESAGPHAEARQLAADSMARKRKQFFIRGLREISSGGTRAQRFGKTPTKSRDAQGGSVWVPENSQALSAVFQDAGMGFRNPGLPINRKMRPKSRWKRLLRRLSIPVVSSAAKYGRVISLSGWRGPDMRQGDWPDAGKLEDLTANSDAILVWTGSPHQVELHGNTPGTHTASKTFVRRGGTVDVMPAGTNLHQVTWTGAPSTCVSVNFSDGYLKELFGEKVPRLDPERGARYGVVDTHVVDLVQRLQHQLKWGEPLGAAYVQGLSLTLASYVLVNTQGIGPTRTQQDPSTRLESEAITAYVEDNLGCNISLLEMAAAAGYSPDHFARLFKRTFRVPPHQYILARRIERAKSMLRDPKLSDRRRGAGLRFFQPGAPERDVQAQHRGDARDVSQGLTRPARRPLRTEISGCGEARCR